MSSSYPERRYSVDALASAVARRLAAPQPATTGPSVDALASAIARRLASSPSREGELPDNVELASDMGISSGEESSPTPQEAKSGPEQNEE
jgi:hypothetical protein